LSLLQHLPLKVKEIKGVIIGGDYGCQLPTRFPKFIQLLSGHERLRLQQFILKNFHDLPPNGYQIAQSERRYRANGDTDKHAKSEALYPAFGLHLFQADVKFPS